MNSCTLARSQSRITVPFSSTLSFGPWTVISWKSTRRPGADNRGRRRPCRRPSHAPGAGQSSDRWPARRSRRAPGARTSRCKPRRPHRSIGSPFRSGCAGSGWVSGPAIIPTQSIRLADPTAAHSSFGIAWHKRGGRCAVRYSRARMADGIRLQQGHQVTDLDEELIFGPFLGH